MPMVRHIILWKLKDSLTDAEKRSVKAAAKEQLEALYGKVPSLRAVTVHIDPLPTSNCDMMLETLFDSADGLKEYAVHPAHVAAADAYVRPYTKERTCMDFTV